MNQWNFFSARETNLARECQPFNSSPLQSLPRINRFNSTGFMPFHVGKLDDVRLGVLVFVLYSYDRAEVAGMIR